MVVNVSRGGESLLITATSNVVGIYPLGGTNLSVVRFTNAEGVVYSTLNTPGSRIQVYPADGLVEILSVVNQTNGVTGAFWFNAFTDGGLQSVSFTKGNFFQVPLVNEF